MNKVDGAAKALPLVVALKRKAPKHRGKTRKRLRVIMMLGAILMLAGGFALSQDASLSARISQALNSSRAQSALPATQPSTLTPRTVVGLARLMPEGDIIRVAPPFGAGDARVAKIHVTEGQPVDAGTILATLDNLPTLENALLAAKSTVALRKAALAQAKQTVRASLMEARATLAETEAAADIAATRLARARILASKGVTTAAALDDLEAAAAQARQAVARARATVARWDTGTLETHPDVVVAMRNFESARIDAERAQRDLARGRVVAPVLGTVLKINVRSGERAGDDGLMTLGQTQRMFARVEIFQASIGGVRIGQKVQLTAAPLGRPLTGVVDRIGIVVERQNMVSQDPAANTDARVIEVVVRLDAESSVRAARFTNLQAVARIDVAGQ